MLIKRLQLLNLVIFCFYQSTVIFAEDATPLPANYVKDITETTPLGPVTGFVANLSEDFTADIFLGIPFADPPVGEKRFEVIL